MKYLRLKMLARFLDGPSTPSDSDIERINASMPVLRALTPDQVYVHRALAVNDRRMSMGIQVPEASLRQMAGLAMGAPIHRNHDTVTADGLPVGRVFQSDLTNDDDGAFCNEQGFYMLRGDPMCDSLETRIQGAVIQELSVSFGYDKMECSIDGGDLWDCNHLPNEMYDGKECTGIVLGVNEYFETSLVWKGAAAGTKITMAADAFGAFESLLAERKRGLSAVQLRQQADWFEELRRGETQAMLRALVG